MTTRDDVIVDYDESPRIIEVEAPSTEMGMQDLVDTVRSLEDDFMKGMSNDKLLDASGKQDLGDGVLVGITVDLDNAQLAFEPRRTAAAVGTATTGSGTPIQSPLGPTYTFVDTGADFIGAGVQRGSLAINFTDHSVADVIEVVSATELRTRVLVNGTNNTWQVGDAYHVFNIIQCNATGGNLVSRDTTDTRITSVFPTAFVQVVRTASSSATIQEQQDIQYASFNGGVTVDLNSPYSGTVYPTGTPRQPVNNFVDALTISHTRGFPTFYIIGNAVIDLGQDYSGHSFIGESKGKSLFTISDAANVTNAEFANATVEGILDGGNVLVGCSLKTINFVDGFIEQCVLNETITLSGGADAHFLDCFSGVPGTSTPTIDMGGSGSGLAMRNYNGGITLTNKTGTDEVSIDLNSGQIILDNSIDGTGTIVMRGVGVWTNQETFSGSAPILNQLLNSQAIIDLLNSTLYDGVTFENTVKFLLSMATGRIVESPTGTFTFYEQDNVTPSFVLTKSGNTRTRS